MNIVSRTFIILKKWVELGNHMKMKIVLFFVTALLFNYLDI